MVTSAFHLWISWSDSADLCLSYHEQHCNERYCKDSPIWRHARGGNGQRADTEDDGGGSGKLWRYGNRDWLWGRSAIELVLL